MIATLDERYSCNEYTTEDGYPIKVYFYDNKNKDIVVVINPACVTIGLITPLLNALQNNFSIVTWEGRGTYLPDNPNVISNINLTATKNIQDLEAILSLLQINRIDHLIGYCSGGELAALALHYCPEYQPKTVSFVSSSLRFENTKKTDYQKQIVQLMKSVLKGGNAIFNIINEIFQSTEISFYFDSKEIADINKNPFSSKERILMYAMSILDLETYSYEEIIGSLEPKKILIVHATDDPVVGFNTACKLYDTTRVTPKMKRLENGGHFVLHTAPESIISIVDYISSV